MDFSRDTALSLFVLFNLGVAAYLLGRTFLRRRNGSSTTEWLILALTGVTIIVALIALEPSEAGNALRLSPEDTSGIFATMLAVGSLVGGIAIADYLYGRILPAIGRRLRDGASSWLVVRSGILVIAAFILGTRILEPQVEVEIGATTD